MKKLINTKSKNTILILLISTALLFSCGKKWKATTKVDFQFYITRSAIILSDDDQLVFSSGSLVVGKFDFSGDRKQGDDVSFSNNLDAAATANLVDGTVTPSLKYDVPQGIYQNISFNVNAIQQNAQPSIIIKGFFTDKGSSNPSIPVIFKLDADQVFNLKAQSKTGTQIALAEGTPAVCKVTFDLPYWFATVTEKLFEKAQQDVVNGETTIIISKDKNENIYNLIAPRINQSNSAIFQ